MNATLGLVTMVEIGMTRWEKLMADKEDHWAHLSGVTGIAVRQIPCK